MRRTHTSTRSWHRAIAPVALVAVLGLVSAGCTETETAPTIAGQWSTSDGSATKIIDEDGRCSGMFYNGTTPLDIGGGMSCSLSDSATDGRYTLVVQQPPNQASYPVEFSGDDEMTLYTSGGKKIVTLTRQ